MRWVAAWSIMIVGLSIESSRPWKRTTIASLPSWSKSPKAIRSVCVEERKGRNEHSDFAANRSAWPWRGGGPAVAGGDGAADLVGRRDEAGAGGAQSHGLP